MRGMTTTPFRLPVLTRRALLELVAAGVATRIVGCDDAVPPAMDASLRDAGDAGDATSMAMDAAAMPCDASTAGFLSECDRGIVASLADYVLIPDTEAGGTDLGAVDYIESLLTALDGATPRIFAGGPFSGRAPSGTRGMSDDFLNFVPLERTLAATWRLRLFGSAGLPGGGPNDSVTGTIEGMRPMFRRVLATLTPEFVAADRVATTWQALPEEFRAEFAQLVVEAAFSAPEYGGNRGLAGWRLVHFPGDVQPRGYTTWDATASRYVERPDTPVSTRDPGTDPDPMSTETLSLLRNLSTVLGGRFHA